MTDIIQELRGLIEKATPGPWETVETKIHWSIASGKQGNHTERRIATTWDHPQSRAPSPVVTGSVGLGFDGGPPAHLVHISEEDAALIVAAINHLPALLDRLEAAERGKAMRDARPNPDWPAATAAMVALAEHGMGADIGELLTHGNPSRGIAPGAIFKMIAAIDAALVGEG